MRGGVRRSDHLDPERNDPARSVHRRSDPRSRRHGRHSKRLPAPAGASSVDSRMPRPLRERIHDIMFQHDSPAERAFDGVLIVSILLSVAVVMLDSVASINARYGRELYIAEWGFTALFTVEY